MSKAMFTVIAPMAELERSVIRERVVAGMEYARARVTKIGQSYRAFPALYRRDQAQELRAQGLSWRQIVSQIGVSPTTVQRAYEDREKFQDRCHRPGNSVL